MYTQHPTFSIQHCTSNNPIHSAPGIKHPAFCIRHPTSSIRIPQSTSNIQHIYINIYMYIYMIYKKKNTNHNTGRPSASWGPQGWPPGSFRYNNPSKKL